MDLEDVYPVKEGAKLLSAEELKGHEHTVTILAVSTIEFESGTPPTALVAKIADGAGNPLEARLKINATNGRTIAAAYGGIDIGTAWVGKQIIIFPNQTPMGLGFGVRIPAPPNAATQALGPQVERTEQLRGVANDAPF